jgi:hypothetical protein
MKSALVLFCVSAVTAACGASVGARQSDSSVRPSSEVTTSRPTSTNTASSSSSASPPEPSPFFAPVVVSDNHLDLESIPPGTPERIDQAQAESIATDALKAFGASGPPLLVEHGMGVVRSEPQRRPVWIVVLSTHGQPMAGGPACPTTAPCERPTLVSDWALAEIDAQSGHVLQQFERGHQVLPSSLSTAQPSSIDAPVRDVGYDDPRAAACFATQLNTRALLEIANGDDFWTVFPKAAGAPEMVAAKDPVFLAVYRGQYPGPVAPRPGTHPATPAPGTTDVCVVFADGSTLVYGSIPLEGSRY